METFQFWDQILKIGSFGSRSSIPINILIINMFDLFWVPNFIKIKQIPILRPNLPKFFILVQGPQFQISYLWLTNLTCSDCQISKHWKYISFFGPNFREMRRLILVLMLNGMLLGHNFDFLGGYCSLPSGYLSLQGCKLFFKTCLARCPEEIIISLNIYETYRT